MNLTFDAFWIALSIVGCIGTFFPMVEALFNKDVKTAGGFTGWLFLAMVIGTLGGWVWSLDMKMFKAAYKAMVVHDVKESLGSEHIGGFLKDGVGP